MVVVGVRLGQHHAVEVLTAQPVEGRMDLLAKVESSIMATVRPVRHKVNSNKALATLTAGLEMATTLSFQIPQRRLDAPILLPAL